MLFGDAACECECSVSSSFPFLDPLWCLALALSVQPRHARAGHASVVHTKQHLQGWWALEAGRELGPPQGTPHPPWQRGTAETPHSWVLFLTTNISPYPNPPTPTARLLAL